MTKQLLLQVYIFLLSTVFQLAVAQPVFKYTASMPNPTNQKIHNELEVINTDTDTLLFKMPNWMPGYYQMMYYSDNVENMTSDDNVTLEKLNRNTWQVTQCKNKTFRLSYDVKAQRRFVACSFLDSAHAYILPEANFLYIEGKLNLPVTVSVILPRGRGWTKIATGLTKSESGENEFKAPNFDILYDCPVLAGNLGELPSFTVRGVNHRFIAYQPGEFDREKLINGLAKIVEAAINILNSKRLKIPIRCRSLS